MTHEVVFLSDMSSNQALMWIAKRTLDQLQSDAALPDERRSPCPWWTTRSERVIAHSDEGM
jgi:hypothetical protein